MEAPWERERTQFIITSLPKIEKTKLRAVLGRADIMSTALDMLSVKVQGHPGRVEVNNSGLEVSAALLK